MPTPHLSKLLAKNKNKKWKDFIPLENNCSKTTRYEHRERTPADACLERRVSPVPDLDSWTAVEWSCATRFFLCPYISVL